MLSATELSNTLQMLSRHLPNTLQIIPGMMLDTSHTMVIMVIVQYVLVL